MPEGSDFVKTDVVDKIDEKSTEDYILDVAKSSSYQNQTREYYSDFLNWRTKKDNPYGYAYVKDVRERTYVDGQGYVSDGPDKAERAALANCSKLVAILLIISQLVTFVERAFVSKLKNISVFDVDFFSYATEGNDIEFDIVLIHSAISIIKYLVPIILFFLITRIPLSVALPKADKKDYQLSISGVAFLLMITTFGRTANFILGRAAGYFGMYYTDFASINLADNKSIAVYCVCEYLIVPILIEILFRGVILQFFRQYGDLFALIISCAVNVLFNNNLMMTGYVALTSIVVGLFALRCGSIYTAIAMRISARLVTMVVSVGISSLESYTAYLAEGVVYMIIVSFALITYSRMISKKNCNFNITDSYTHLSTRSKIVVLFSVKEVIIWLVMVLVSMIFSVRFM